MSTNYTVPAVDKALTIIEFVAKEQPVAFTRIHTELGLAKGSVHQILSNLQARGYMRKTNEGFVLGLAFFELGGLVAQRLNIRAEVRSILQRLRDRLRLTCHFGVLDGDRAVYLVKVESNRDIIIPSWEGKRVFLRTSGLGKALLSGFADEELPALLSSIPMETTSGLPAPDDETMLRRIIKTRERGWAIDDQEDVVGIRCVAAPVRNSKGNVVAAISVTGAVSHLPMDEIEDVAAVVKEAASELGEAVGDLNLKFELPSG